jgi:hypothetical protein
VFVPDPSQGQGDLTCSRGQIEDFAFLIDEGVLFGESFTEETLNVVLVRVVILRSFFCVEFIDAHLVRLAESTLHFFNSKCTS